MDKPLFNTTFADSRNISKEDQEAMNRIYKLLHENLQRPLMRFVTPKQAVEIIEGLEYTLQLFWNFPPDRSFHNYWFEIKGCTCPKLDNRERSGSGHFIISNNCPYHGVNKADTWEDKRFKWVS